MSEDEFRKRIDEIVLEATIEDIPEHATIESINWVDELARKRDISFYDMIYEILHKHDIKSKAEEWLKNKDE